MEPNPYESPKAESTSAIDQLLLSPLRIPLAVICGIIAVVFVATFVAWCIPVFQLGLQAPEGRKGLVYLPMALVECGAFVLIAAGLFERHVTALSWGLGLFVLGFVGQVVLIALGIS